jgi:hypothetical protein
MDGHIDGLAVNGQLLLVGSGVAAGDGLVGHTATLLAGRLAGTQRADGHQACPGRARSTVR